MGLHEGALFSMSALGIAESDVLGANPDYPTPRAGDTLDWSFGADLEYISNSTLTVSLVFGEHERVLAEDVELQGSDKQVEHFEGAYTVTEEDAAAGLPFVRVTFRSEKSIKLLLEYVNVSVRAPERAGPDVAAKVVDDGIALNWSDPNAQPNSQFRIYRQANPREAYQPIHTTSSTRFVDRDFIHGLNYRYVVTRLGEPESAGSAPVVIAKADAQAPTPPRGVQAEVFDAEVNVRWDAPSEPDVASYTVYRGNAQGQSRQAIAQGLNRRSFIDFTPAKGVNNTYAVVATDHSGNESQPSEPITARVKTVPGASFSDLIRPMPIVGELRSDLWGADSVLPRDPSNGIEHPDWSYWGGRPVKDHDGRYHMVVTRWPANATKGHWEWPHSTVAHAVSDHPVGPYRVERETAYDFRNGLGHNPNIVLLNDGTYLLYSLIDWKPTMLHSTSMAGPWKRLGVLTYDASESGEPEKLHYRFERNLSGVHLNDGRFLFVTKAGAMMVSEDANPLGPYKVLTRPLQGNPVVPEKYRNSNYEDPVLWKDEVQFHMIINAFLDYRAIYLRSPDGIHWICDPGTAYTPGVTAYEDGTRTKWYKLERPHILQDEHGRATHLALAAIDVPKRQDLARDKHSSKNMVLPLVVHKRLAMQHTEPITGETTRLEVLIRSEPSFDPSRDLDLDSLRFGASAEVNFGRGGRAIENIRHDDGMLVVFEDADAGLLAEDYVGKLLGLTKDGKLVIGFARLPQR